MILYSLNPSQLFERHSVFLFFPRSCFCFIWLYTIDDHTLENFGPEWHSKSAPKLKTPLEITPPQKKITHQRSLLLLLRKCCSVEFLTQASSQHSKQGHVGSCVNVLGKGHFLTLDGNNRVRIRNFRLPPTYPKSDTLGAWKGFSLYQKQKGASWAPLVHLKRGNCFTKEPTNTTSQQSPYFTLTGDTAHPPHLGWAGPAFQHRMPPCGQRFY